jgi:hypothetical protein
LSYGIVEVKMRAEAFPMMTALVSFGLAATIAAATP